MRSSHPYHTYDAIVSQPDAIIEVVRANQAPIAKTRKRISSCKRIFLVGNLDASRDYLDVRDVVQAYKLVIQKDIPSGTALNVCSGKGIKVRQIT